MMAFFPSKLAIMAAVLMAPTPSLQALSPPATKMTAGYVVKDVGTFNTMFKVDFTKSSTIPSDLHVSSYTVGAGEAPYARKFYTSNVRINKGDSVSLLVQPNLVNGQISSAEFATTYKDILYGSVRTVAKASSVGGTCHGFFSYLNDNQETDIEILTKDLKSVWFTNQALTADGKATSVKVAAPANMATAYHEYRIDWLKGRVRFYIDGVLKKEITSNVPTMPSAWIWNNWSNGDDGWSAGPPKKLNDLRIQSITAYWNRTKAAN